MKTHFDVVVVGGGINGCGAAADAASRGLSVLLCEKDDLASKTSSASTKLIHGGLRYLEQFDFKLVRKALKERQQLINLAPYLIKPIPLLLPYHKQIRPYWMLGMGLFLYDHLTKENKLPRSQRVSRKNHPSLFNSLQTKIEKGYLFYDAKTDDARLTIANALQAKQFGATLLTHTKLIHSESKDSMWLLDLQGPNHIMQVTTKAIINATGPWVTQLEQLFNVKAHYPITLVKGSHLIVPRLYEGDHGYVLQHADKRIIFLMPYHGFTMIGTTDLLYENDLNEIEIDESEKIYLIDLVNDYFKTNLALTHIKSSWSGVRTLLFKEGTSPKALSREFAYHYTRKPGPLVTIYSGKMTTYRELGKQVVDALHDVFPKMGASITHERPLPGTPLNQSFVSYKNHVKETYRWLNETLLDRYLENYGTNLEKILHNKSCISDLGIDFGNNLYQAEVDYLYHEEWARSIDDILWRRTKLGLYFNPTQTSALESYFRDGLFKENFVDYAI